VESFTLEVVAHTEQEARTMLDAALYNKYDRHEVRYERKSKRMPIDFIAERLAVERYDFHNFKPIRFGVKGKGYFDMCIMFYRAFNTGNFALEVYNRGDERHKRIINGIKYNTPHI